MNKDDIIRMAWEAGLKYRKHLDEVHTPQCDGVHIDELELFAELVTAAEFNRIWTQNHWTAYEESIAAAWRCGSLCRVEKPDRKIVSYAEGLHARDAAAALVRGKMTTKEKEEEAKFWEEERRTQALFDGEYDKVEWQGHRRNPEDD